MFDASRSLLALAGPFSVLVAGGYAQNFDSELLLQTPDRVDLLYADMDGDGDLDAVTIPVPGASGIDRIAWAENTSGNTSGAIFAGWQIMEPTASPGTVHFTSPVDLDGDGDLDLVQARNGGSLGWLENLGAGQLAAYAVLGSHSSNITGIRAADLDGDGDQDILVTAGQPTPVGFENLGSMTYRPGVAFAGTVSIGLATDVEWLDMDQDGLTDVVWFHSGTVYWARFTGTGFAPTQALNIPATPGSFYWPRKLADMDGDGDLDLVSHVSSTQQLGWFENTGGLLFVSPNVIGTAAGLLVEFGDQDNDGDMDIFSANDYVVKLHNNLGAGQFAAPVNAAHMNPGAFAFTKQFLVHDLDGDGDLDPVVVEQDEQDEIRWAENLGTGSFELLADIGVRTSEPNNPVAVESQVDFDFDGDLDLVTVGPREYGYWSFFANIYLSENTGNGKLGSGLRLFSAENAINAVAFDADGDGDKDVAVGSGELDEVGVDLFTNVNGSFSSNPGSAQNLFSFNFSEGGATLRLGDADGSGGEDLLMTYRSFGSQNLTAAWIRNTGGGNFPVQTSWQINYPQNIIVADVDGDGDDDVSTIQQTTANDSVTVFENLGAGVMGPGQILGTYPAGSTAWLEIVDADGDGDKDFMALRSVGNQVLLHENLGNGQYSPGQVIVVTAPNSEVILGRDLDLDGDQDVLVFSEEEANWYPNLGGGSYGLPIGIPQLDGVLYATWAAGEDLDGDTDVDLIKVTPEGLAIQLNDLRFGEGYCGPAVVNTSGASARIWAEGSPAVADNNLTISADQMPTGQFGFFLVSDNLGFVPMPGSSEGNLCLGGAIGRLNRGPGEIFNTGLAGSAAVSLDVTDVPTPLGPEVLVAGTTRYFQAWFRDQNPAPTSNFTSGMAITFE